MFDSKNEAAVCELVVDSDRKALMIGFLCQFRRLRTIYRAKSPKTDYPEEVKFFKMSAVKMGKLLLENFSFVEWQNYPHKLIEHVQELIQHDLGPGSIGMFSCEGNECGNKVLRHFRKDDVTGGLRDVLQLHWLYSSKVWQELSSETHKQNRCSVCFGTGHIRNNCLNANLLNNLIALELLLDYKCYSA